MQLHRSTIEECWRPPGDQALSVAYKRRRRVHLAWTGGNRFAALLMLALVLIDGLSFNSHAGPANTLGSTMSERSARTLGSCRQACRGGRGPGQHGLEFTQARGG